VNDFTVAAIPSDSYRRSHRSGANEHGDDSHRPHDRTLVPSLIFDSGSLRLDLCRRLSLLQHC
jgi:hypothetical protein